ncbi:MAG: hypothetical protein COB02_05800 [Candidatus Cloacimonadota bacterium]|nr:MAG: hypothetical protein COB02_05800 [Candidatus Cloacimonadota bacterium]
MKNLFKLSILTGFVSTLITIGTYTFCESPHIDSSTKSSNLEYLELRGLNYDYVHFYKKSEDHKNNEEYIKSQENALQYKKKLNSYLLKSPTIKSIQDPNGYFSSDEQFGFNPLKEESINSLFKAKPYLIENGTHYFSSIEENKSNPLKIEDPEKIADITGFSDEDFNLEFNEEDFSFAPDGLPIDNGQDLNISSGLTTTASITNAKTNTKPTEENTNSKQPRFSKGVHKLSLGVKKLTIATKRLHLAIKRYKDYINSENVHPDKVNFMRDKLQMHISKLHRINGILLGYGQNLNTVGTKHKFDTLKRLEAVQARQSFVQNKLLQETDNFEILMEETGNSYRFIPTAQLETAFVPPPELISGETSGKVMPPTPPIKLPTEGVPSLPIEAVIEAPPQIDPGSSNIKPFPTSPKNPNPPIATPGKNPDDFGRKPNIGLQVIDPRLTIMPTENQPIIVSPPINPSVLINEKPLPITPEKPIDINADPQPSPVVVEGQQPTSVESQTNQPTLGPKPEEKPKPSFLKCVFTWGFAKGC